MAMKEDRAREGKKAQYRKMGFGPMMKSGEIDFGDKHPLLKAKKEKQKNYQNPKKDERFNAAFRARMKKAGLKDSEIGDTRLKIGGLSGGQKKIAAKAPPTNKIDAKDFAVLRAEKAKDRGMGLQDEKVKPGKVIKAKRGDFMKRRLTLGGLDDKTIKAYMKTVGAFPAVNKPKSSQGTTAKSAKGKTFTGFQKVFETGSDRSTPKSQRGTSTIIGVKPKLPKPSKESSLARRALKSVQATSLGKKLLPVVAAGVAAQQYLKSKMKKKKELKGDIKGSIAPYKTKKKMGGGMMKVPGYVSGTDKMGVKPKIKYSSSVGKTVTIKDGRIALTDPDTPKAGPKAGRPKAPPPPRKRRLPQQARRSVGKRAGLGALGGTGRKEDSSVTLGKFMKAKTDALNESVKAGGMKKERITQGSNMRRPEAFVKDVEAGKYNKPNKDAAYYKSIGLTGERGDRAVKDFFKPSDVRLKNIMAGNYMGGGMMNKPMGYKSGKSIKVKCKLGKNKPTKMY